MLAAGLYLNRALEEFAVESIEARLASVADVLQEEARAMLRDGAARRGSGLRHTRGARRPARASR